MIRRLAIGIAVAWLAASAAGQTPSPAPADLLQPFAFLLGNWEAAPGASGETGGFSFRTEAQGRVIVRTNYASYPASAGKPPSRHDDVMIIFVDGGRVRAEYFDSEGHVIRYAGQSPGRGEAQFVSDAKPDEPRYRLSYKTHADGSLEGKFEVAAPGAPDRFAPYLSWTAQRR